LAVLKNPAYHFKRIGLEAGLLSQWLFSALAEAGLPVICVETRGGNRRRHERFPQGVVQVFQQRAGRQGRARAFRRRHLSNRPAGMSTVAAEIGADDRKVASKQRRDAAPHQMRLRKAVQQEDPGGPDPDERTKMLVSSV
jgi:transposase